MHGFLTKFGILFSPEQVKVLAGAFDDAWARLQASGAPYGAPDYAEAARAHLAKYIISTARHGGDLQPRKLADDALLHLSRQVLSRVPPRLVLL